MIYLEKDKNNVVALTLLEKLPVSFSGVAEYLFYFKNDLTNLESTFILDPLVNSWRFQEFNINISASTVLNTGFYVYQVYGQTSGSTNTDITFSGASLVETGKVYINGDNPSINNVYR
jgi:hypothetical protein